MSNCYRYINLPFEFFDLEKTIEFYSKSLTDPSKNKHWRIDGPRPNIFNDEAYKWLEQFDVTVGVAELFYTAPHSKISWHIDMNMVTPIFEYVKINFVYCKGSDHYMKWGETKFKNTENKIKFNLDNNPYLMFNQDEIFETESITIEQPTLVNVGLPHLAINDTNFGRWCFCLIPKKNDMRISFPQAVDIFKDYVI